MRRDLDRVLEEVNAAKSQGQEVEAVQLGDARISTIDLLVRKAILLKTEADRMMFDNMNRKKKKFDEINDQFKQATNKVTSEEELAQELVVMQKKSRKELMRGFDEKTYREKLQEAYSLLEEAHRLDDENTEVLLLMASSLITLTPDDPLDEQKLLYRVQALLHKPKNNVERLQIAQATYLIAASFANMFMTKSPGPDTDSAINAMEKIIPSLREARDLFAELGENQWLQLSEELLKGIDHEQVLLRQSEFEIRGRWHLLISSRDIPQGVMKLDFAQDSSFKGTLLPSGQMVQGRWAFVPMQRSLHLQGSIGGFQPFAIDVRFKYVKEGFASGEGSDGLTYALTKPELRPEQPVQPAQPPHTQPAVTLNYGGDYQAILEAQRKEIVELEQRLVNDPPNAALHTAQLKLKRKEHELQLLQHEMRLLGKRANESAARIAESIVSDEK